MLYLLAFPIGFMGVVQLFFFFEAYVFESHLQSSFLNLSLAYFCMSGLSFFLGRGIDPSSIRYRHTLLFASSVWLVMGVLGAGPIYLIAEVSITDAVFESISGLTTTGATILSGLDAMPKSFLLYRQFLQWMGGLGIVVFVVAILPMLNVGGLKLLRAETPGPMEDEKLSPRIIHTAHYLWIVYILLTVLCAASYYFAGMTGFDAVAHAFATISTGGFSTHDASMGYFNSNLILAITDIFMLFGAISFALHFKVWRRLDLSLYFQEEETRFFIIIVSLFSIIVLLMLIHAYPDMDMPSAISSAVFHLISFITSTGYGAGNFTDWPAELQLLLVIAAYFGGCAGSTAGGNKIIRNIITGKAIGREFKRLIHPAGIYHIKFNGNVVEDSVLHATLAFMFVSAITTSIFTVVMMLTGLDFWSSLSAVAACINVLGPAFGELGNNFQPVSDIGTWILSFLMLLGRLEYFTFLAILLPAFWKA